MWNERRGLESSRLGILQKPTGWLSPKLWAEVNVGSAAAAAPRCSLRKVIGLLTKRRLLASVLALATSGNALACPEPPKTAFRDIVTTAPTVFTFQVTSAYFIHKPVGPALNAEYIVGLITVVDTLKGDASSFKMIQYGFRSCGAIRMSVGQIYLAATSQNGSLLRLWGTDQAILDLSRDFYHESTKHSWATDEVKSILQGGHMPQDFPRDALQIPLDVYPVSQPLVP